MSKVSKKNTLNIKGVIYIEDKVISLEDENGELVAISDFAGEFDGKEVSLSIAYAEEIE